MHGVRWITSIAGLAVLLGAGAGCRSDAPQKRLPGQASPATAPAAGGTETGGASAGDDGAETGAAEPTPDPLAPRTEVIGDGMKRFQAAGVAMDYPDGWSLQARKLEAKDRIVLHVEIVMPDASAAAIDIYLDAKTEADLGRIAAYYPRRMGGVKGAPKQLGKPKATLLGNETEGRAMRLSPKEPANPELKQVRIEAFAGQGHDLTVEAAFITADLELTTEASARVRAQFVTALGTIARRTPDAP